MSSDDDLSAEPRQLQPYGVHVNKLWQNKRILIWRHRWREIAQEYLY